MALLRLNAGIFQAAGDALIAAIARVSRFWPFSWQSFSAIVLGILLAHWAWILLAPQSIHTSAVPERAATQEAERLFGLAASGNETSQGVALPNAKLIGVFAASAYKPGFAILKLENGRQAGAAIGEEVAPGVKLVEIKSTHVLLERAGVQQKVELENQYEPVKGDISAVKTPNSASRTSGPPPAYGANAKPGAPPSAYSRSNPRQPPMLAPGINQRGGMPPMPPRPPAGR